MPASIATSSRLVASYPAGLTAAEIGRLACRERIELHQLSTERTDLEQAFFALTGDTDQEGTR